MSTQIGTVELKRVRIYPLDQNSTDPLGLQTTVYVQPGIFPLYEGDLQMRYWLMKGWINKRGFFRYGDGLSAIQSNDEPSDIPVTFPSRVFGPEEWERDFVGMEGFKDRFDVVIFEEAVAHARRLREAGS